MHEVLVKEEEVVAIPVFDRSTYTLVGPFSDFNHLIKSKCITLTISSRQSASASWGIKLLSEVFELDRHNLVLLVDQLQVVFLNLKHKACVLIVIIVNKISSLESVVFACDCKHICTHRLVSI